MPSADDLLAISDLLARYCHLVDRGDVDGVADLFAPDAVLRPTFESDEPVEGRDAIRAWFTSYREARRREGRWLRHMVTVPVVDLDGDRARATSYLTADMLLTERDVPRVSVGRYDDRLVRAGGRWRFAERQIVVHYVRTAAGSRLGRAPDQPPLTP